MCAVKHDSSADVVSDVISTGALTLGIRTMRKTSSGFTSKILVYQIACCEQVACDSVGVDTRHFTPSLSHLETLSIQPCSY